MDVFDPLFELARENAATWSWRLVAAAAALALAWMAMRLARATLHRTMDRSDSLRARTLRPLVQGLTTTVIVGTGIVLALEQLGLDLTAVIAGAGVLGLALGFGAQELVKDVIAGFFLIFDEVLETGDWVDIDTVSGNVEEVALRVTKIRSIDGRLWYVPNGQIKQVGNASRSWVRAVVHVELAYEQDVARGMAALAEITQAWAAEHAESVLDPPEVQGLMSLGASGLGARVLIKVRPGTQWAAERELRLRLKAHFDREGIEIPFGRQVVYLRNSAGEAAAS